MKMAYILVTLSMFISLVSSCQKQKPETEGKGVSVLEYWYPWGGDSEKWDQGRMKEFEKSYPNIKINATYVPPDGGLANGKLLAAVAGGTVPDVIISNDAGRSYSLAAQGALSSLDEPLAKAKFNANELLPAFRDIMQYEGVTYIFPHDTNVNMLYIDLDALADAGISEDFVPATIEELDALAKQLTIVKDGDVKRMGFVPWIDAGGEAFLWPWMFGANMYSADTKKLNLTSGKIASVFNWLRTYADIVSPKEIQTFTSSFGGAFSPDHAMMQGKVAMTVMGNWFTNAIRIYAPNLRYKVVPIPAPPESKGGRYGGSTMGTNVFLVPKGAKNIDAAIKFMLFASQPEISAGNINTWRSLSVWKKKSNAIIWDKEGDPIYAIIRKIAASPNSGHPGLTSISQELIDNLNQIRDKVIYEGSAPEPLLAELEERLQQEIYDQ